MLAFSSSHFQEMPGHVAMLAAEARLVRTASFRQLQALSHAIAGLQNPYWQNLDSFATPQGYHIRAVEQGEVRIV